MSSKEATAKLLDKQDGMDAVPTVVMNGEDDSNAGLDVLLQHDGLLVREKMFWYDRFGIDPRPAASLPPVVPTAHANPRLRMT
jgi:hypothetical protein